jgi:hypothetical protein
MRNSLISACITAALFVAPATASANSVAKAMGNLRWGMSDTEVASVVKAALKKEYRARIKKAGAASKHMLKSEYSRRLRSFQNSLVEFNGRSHWDRTSIGEEYTHGNGESMMVLEGDDFDNYYFFMDGRLWKWVRTMPARSFGNYKKFSKSIQKKFGRGYEKQDETNPGSGREYRFIEYLDRNSRLRAVDRSGEHGDYALVFEEMATVRNLSALRPGVARRSKPRRSRAARDRAPDSSTERAAPDTDKKHRRVFSKQKRAETEKAYQERKRRVQEKYERAQRAKYERKKAAKRAKALEALKGLEDDDPLAGAR